MKKSKWLLCALAALLLAGCSLARPEESKPGGDRFAGFYVVHTQGYSDRFYDNPYREEYGADSIETDQFGTLSFPREVLFAAEDEAGNYVFPGMEDGYSLFLVEKNEEYGHVSDIVCNMAPGEKGNSIYSTDSETTNTISGTIYCGPPLGAEDWDEHEDGGVWTYYRVYQTEDDRVYIDGSGNSTGGGGFGYSENRTQTMTDWNGESVMESIDVHVQVEIVERMERLVVTQFDGTNAIVRSDDLALRDELPEIACEPGTAWVLVEEIRADGTARTVYNVPEDGEDPISHMVVLLDDEGLGQLAYLTVRP